MIVVGLTGSVGMGKSTAASMFADEGVPVFDSDAVVHRLYLGEAVASVEAAFPGVTSSGIIDRERLGRRVVCNPAAMKRLEDIVHPLVRRERETFISTARGRREPMVVLDIPLLFETGAEVDAVVVVSAPEPVQKARVMARQGMTEERLAAILASQVPDAEKRRRARFVIETGEGFEPTRRQVRDVIAALKASDLARDHFRHRNDGP